MNRFLQALTLGFVFALGATAVASAAERPDPAIGRRAATHRNSGRTASGDAFNGDRWRSHADAAVLSVDVPAHGRVRFEPNGLHVMLIDLVRPLKKGDRFTLTLTFQHAGPVRVEALVQDLGTMTAPVGEDRGK
jgi:hypothetical protein